MFQFVIITIILICFRQVSVEREKFKGECLNVAKRVNLKGGKGEGANLGRNQGGGGVIVVAIIGLRARKFNFFAPIA